MSFLLKPKSGLVGRHFCTYCDVDRDTTMFLMVGASRQRTNVGTERKNRSKIAILFQNNEKHITWTRAAPLPVEARVEQG